MGTALAVLFLAAAPSAPPPADELRVLVPSPRAGAVDLFLVDPLKGDVKNLTNTEQVEELCPAWSPDGKRIAFTCRTREHAFEVYVCAADGSNRKLVSTTPDPRSACVAPSWSADGKKLVYGRSYPNGKHEIRVAAVDGASDEVIRAEAIAPAWSLDGTAIAFVRKMAGKPHALCVMAPDGSGVKVLVEDLGPQDIFRPAWSPDSKLIAIAATTDHGVQLMLAPAAGGSPRQLTHVPGYNFHPVWLSPDRILFSHLNPPGGGGAAYVTIKADGTRLAVHPLTKVEPPHPLLTPAVFVPRVEPKPEREPNPVRPAAFTAPASSKLVAVKASPLTVLPPPVPGAIGAAVWAADGKRLAVGLEAGPILVGEFDGKLVRTAEALRGHEGPVEGLAFTPDGGTLYSAGADKSVRTWDIAKKGTTGIQTDHDAGVASLAIAAGGKHIASAGRDGTLKLRDAATGKTKHDIAVCDAKRTIVQAVAFGKDDAVVFAGCARWNVPVLHGSVTAFDVATGEELWKTKSAFGGVTGLAISPDGAKLAGACLDTHLRIWDAKTGRELACWKGHADRLTSVAWALGGKLLVSSGFDHTVRLWDAESGVVLHTLAAHTSPVTRIAASPDGKFLMSGGQDGALFVWKLTE